MEHTASGRLVIDRVSDVQDLTACVKRLIHAGVWVIDTHEESPSLTLLQLEIDLSKNILHRIITRNGYKRKGEKVAQGQVDK